MDRFWCSFWCMLFKQQVTSYQPCPVMAKGRCSQTAMNSYRLMCNINGEGFLIRIPPSNTGKELQQMISLQIPQKPGTGISLQHESKKLSLHKSLKEQGFQGEVTLSYVYTQLDLPGPWNPRRYSKAPGALGYLLGFQGQPLDDNEREGKEIPKFMESRAFRTPFCLAVCKAWLLALFSARAWRRSLCRAVCKAWLLWFFQPEPEERHFALRFAKLDFWQSFRPEPGERDFSRQFAKLDFWQSI